jgi:hypothetical protein
MPRQLIYTSAARGLTPGQSGYCTVARSRDLREALVPKLEKLSYYTPEQNHNPIVCAHRIVEVRGTKFHVLTRIVDAGLDFTKRRSFLAHHLVFDPEELRDAATPAEIFLHWKGWLQNWHGDPQWLEDNRPLPTRARRESTIAKYDLWISGHEADRNDFLPVLLARGANWEITFTNCFQPSDNPGDFDFKAAWPNTPGYQAAQRLGGEFIRLADLPETPKTMAAPVASAPATVAAAELTVPVSAPTNRLFKLLPFAALILAMISFGAALYIRRGAPDPVVAAPAPAPAARSDETGMLESLLPDRPTWVILQGQPTPAPELETLLRELRANEVFTKDLTGSLQPNLGARPLPATLFAQPEHSFIRFTATNGASMDVNLSNNLAVFETHLRDSCAAEIPGRFRLLAIKTPVELSRRFLLIGTNVELQPELETRVHRLEIPPGAQFALRPLVREKENWIDPLAKAAHDFALVPSTILDLPAVDAHVRQIISDKETKLRAYEEEQASLADAQKKLVTEPQSPEQLKQNDRLHALQLAIPKATRELEDLRAKAAAIPRDAARIDRFALFLCLSNVNTEVFRFIDKP